MTPPPDDISDGGPSYQRLGHFVSRRAVLAMLFALQATTPSEARDRTFFGRRPAVPARRTYIPRNLGPITRQEIAFSTDKKPGTILIDTKAKLLYLLLGSNRALTYRVGVGREGFGWKGRVAIGAKAEWPSWRPPDEMRKRDPALPDSVPPGPLNPLGARAIYLHTDGVDTLYRIHGTNETGTVGGNGSSGCFRLTNADVIELYVRVRIGATVIVY